MSDLTIRKGTCHALFAYDVAYAIDLDLAQQRIASTAERVKVHQRRRAPDSFEYRPAPLLVTVQVDPIQLGEYTTSPSVELVLYDFGAISVSFVFPLAGPFDGLPALAVALRGRTPLLPESFLQIQQLMKQLGPAAARPRMSEVQEGYNLFVVESFTQPVEPEELWTRQAGTVARVLRGEERPLAEQEISDATAYRLSFAADDVVFIDTDAALLYDKEGEDACAVIELANTQLMEMRHLDQQLDTALDRAYEMLARQRTGGPFKRRRPDLHRLTELQLDGAVLLEQVSNAVKLIGDHYLSRVYARVSQRFRLEQWDASISRKLQTVESIYTKMVDRSNARRMEVLEWIIVILIAFEIVLGLVH